VVLDASRNRHNIVLTGPPRSGTTLSCYLLGKVENTVALNEPLRPARFGRFASDPDALADAVERWYRQTRRKIRTEGRAPSKHRGGKPTFETFGEPGESGRDSVLELGEIAVDKPLKPGFFLVVNVSKLQETPVRRVRAVLSEDGVERLDLARG
jgi:hypothetical protein